MTTIIKVQHRRTKLWAERKPFTYWWSRNEDDAYAFYNESSGIHAVKTFTATSPADVWLLPRIAKKEE